MSKISGPVGHSRGRIFQNTVYLRYRYRILKASDTKPQTHPPTHTHTLSIAPLWLYTHSRLHTRLAHIIIVAHEIFLSNTNRQLSFKGHFYCNNNEKNNTTCINNSIFMNTKQHRLIKAI